MSTASDATFLSTFLRGVRDACLGHVTFNSRITVSGFLCISVDGNYQSQFVVDEIFDKQNHEGSHNSYCLKKLEFKGSRPHLNLRQCHKEARPKGLGTQIQADVPMRNAGRRRNKPFCTVKSQCAFPSNSKIRTQPVQCQLEANSRLQRQTAIGDSRFPEINYSPPQNNAISKEGEHLNELSSPKQAVRSRTKAQSNLSLHSSPDKLSSRSQVTHRQTNTRHFFRSSSRNEKNNTTFTLDGKNVPRTYADKDNAIQNKSAGETPFHVVRNFNKPYGQVNPRKNGQNLGKSTSEKEQMSEISRRNTFEPIRNKLSTNKLYKEGKTVPRNLSEQKKEHNQSFNYSQPSTSKRGRCLKVNGSTETLSHHASYVSCLSGTEFDVSYDFDMNNFDETGYLSEQDISIIATEPPYGFVETNLDPYNCGINYPYVKNETNSNLMKDTHLQLQSPLRDKPISPINSEPVIRSSEKAFPREAYSDGNILDNNINIDVNRTLENLNNISLERIYQSGSTIKSPLSPDPNIRMKHIDSKHIQAIQKRSAIDNNLNIDSKSHQRNYMGGNKIWEQEMKIPSEELTSYISHPNRKSESGENYMTVRRENIHPSSHQGTSSRNHIAMSLSHQNEEEFAPLITSVKPRPRAWRSFPNDDYAHDKDAMHKSQGTNGKSAHHTHDDVMTSGEAASSRPDFFPCSPTVVGVRPRPAQAAHDYRDLHNLQGSAISQVSVRCQGSAGSQGSAGDWGTGAEVRDSPSAIKKKSRLRKLMRIFKKDSSPMPLRDADAQHKLTVPSPTESHNSVNWPLRSRHRLPVSKKKVNSGGDPRQTRAKDSKAGVRF